MASRIDLYSNTDHNYPQLIGLVTVYCGANRTNIVATTLGEAAAKARELYGDLPVRYEALPIEGKENLVIGGAAMRDGEAEIM